MEWHNTPKMLIVYCTLAGLISAWAISGLLAIVDSVSGTPPGTFFAVIGLSLGFNDPVSAQYIGLGLHILTGTCRRQHIRANSIILAKTNSLQHQKWSIYWVNSRSNIVGNIVLTACNIRNTA